MTIAEEARNLVGTRFRHLGRGEHGLDCAGLVIESYRRALGADIDERGYPREPTRARVMAWVNRHFDRLVGREAVACGDMALVRLGSNGLSFAVVTEKGGAIFASAQVGRVVEISYLHDADVVGFYRMRS